MNNKFYRNRSFATKKNYSDYNFKNLKTNVPEIVFDDIELQINIGQWLGMFPNKPKRENSLNLNTIMSTSEFISTMGIDETDLKNVAIAFGILMKKIGIDCSETCNLSKFDKSNHLFNCTLQNSNHVFQVALEYGDYIETFNTLTLIDKDFSKTYNFYKINNNQELMLSLASEQFKSDKNNSILKQYIMFCSYFVTIENNNYTLSLNIVSGNDYEEYFKIPNEEKLREYLLSLTFPLSISITELLQNITNITSISGQNCSKIDIKVQIHDEDNYKILDQIVISDKKIVNATITKNGRTISYTEQDEWNYQNKDIIVSKDKKGNFDYKLVSMPQDKINTLLSPLEQIKVATEEVEETKNYVKKYYN